MRWFIDLLWRLWLRLKPSRSQKKAGDGDSGSDVGTGQNVPEPAEVPVATDEHGGPRQRELPIPDMTGGQRELWSGSETLSTSSGVGDDEPTQDSDALEIDQVPENEAPLPAATEDESELQPSEALDEASSGGSDIASPQSTMAGEPEAEQQSEQEPEVQPEPQPQPEERPTPSQKVASPPPPELRRRPGKESEPRGHYTQRVASPEVRLDPVSGRFWLVIPSQRVPADIYDGGEEHVVDVSVAFIEDAKSSTGQDGFRDRSSHLDVWEDEADYVRTSEISVELEKSFFWLSVKYPSVLKEREFSFHQAKADMYVFEERCDTRIRMFDRYEEPEHPHPLPRGFLWLVHTDDIEVPKSYIVEEDTRTFWDHYRVTVVDTRERDRLQLYNAEEGEPLELMTRLQPQLEGGRIQDAEPSQMPAFTSDLKVHVPANDQETVQLVLHRENARTAKRHQVRPDADAAFDLGEMLADRAGVYRLDVGTSSKRDDWESIWFRWLPHIASLDYPQDLILPGPKGHEEIVAKLGLSGRAVPVFDETGQEIGPPRQGVLCVRMASGQDEKQLFVGGPRRPRGVPIVIRLFRLRWRLFQGGDRGNWVDTPLTLERDQVSVGSTALIETSVGPRAARGLRFELRSRSQTVQVAKAEVLGGQFHIALSQFDATARVHREALFLIVALGDSKEAAPTTLAEVEPIGYQCRWCEHVAETGEELLTHVSENHIREIFAALSYDEIRQRHVPELPHAIYECPYCQAYVKADDSRGSSPTTSIKNHIDKFHAGKRHAFSSVVDTDEIRRRIDINLPHVYQCGLCGEDIRIQGEDSDEPLVQHLLKSHGDELWE